MSPIWGNKVGGGAICTNAWETCVFKVAPWGLDMACTFAGVARKADRQAGVSN
jgi:hypothetical protein